ncbi:hypothetical protein WME73_36575 [Sorangium sp. So ce302]
MGEGRHVEVPRAELGRTPVRRRPWDQGGGSGESAFDDPGADVSAGSL